MNTRSCAFIGAAFLATALPASAHAAAYFQRITTGLSGTTLIASGTNDDDWDLVSAPGGAITGDARVIDNNGGWFNPAPAAKWISTQSAGSTGNTNVANGTYVYRYVFNAPAVPQQQLSIAGTYGSDDSVTAITLNGNNIFSGGVGGFSPTTRDFPSAFSSSNPAFFNVGVNTLDVTVLNGGGAPNPHGFVLQGAVFTGIPGLFNTGVENSGALRGDNLADLHYTLAGPQGAPLAIVMQEDGSPVPPWMNNGPVSKWLRPNTDNDGNSLAGLYTWTTTFDLTGYDPASAIIGGQWAADDLGVSILLNGVDFGAGQLSGGFGSFTPFTLTTGFTNGVNTLSFVTNNGGGPGGIRVEMFGSATLVPEPATVSLLAAGAMFIGLRRRRRA